MSDMHVMTGNGETWTIVMHIPVPNTNNAVGVNHRTALVNSGYGVTDGRRTILTQGSGVGEISAAEEALLDNGVLYEHVGSFLAESGGTSNSDLQASIREFYDTERTTVLNRLAACFRYYGHTESAS